jgi:hypothetical protein
VGFTHSGDEAPLVRDSASINWRLLGTPQCAKRLLSSLEKTNIQMAGPEKTDEGISRIRRYEDWCNFLENPDSEYDGSVIQGRSNEALCIIFYLVSNEARDHNPTYTWGNDTQVDKGKHSIASSTPQKSFLDSASNCHFRTNP